MNINHIAFAYNDRWGNMLAWNADKNVSEVVYNIVKVFEGGIPSFQLSCKFLYFDLCDFQFEAPNNNQTDVKLTMPKLPIASGIWAFYFTDPETGRDYAWLRYPLRFEHSLYEIREEWIYCGTISRHQIIPANFILNLAASPHRTNHTYELFLATLWAVYYWEIDAIDFINGIAFGAMSQIIPFFKSVSNRMKSPFRSKYDNFKKLETSNSKHFLTQYGIPIYEIHEKPFQPSARCYGF